MNQQIVHNTGINNTLYYNVINYFKTIMSNHPSIAYVTVGDVWDIGEKQFPKYPIANIQILNSNFGTNVTNFSCQLTIADKVKNKNNESDPPNNKEIVPFFGFDDTNDIWANTLAIMNDLTSYTQRGVQGFDIDDDIVCTPFEEKFDNGLAGWVANFTLTTHNDKNRCLFFLVEPFIEGYVITDCLTNTKYQAIIKVEQGQTIGGAFATKINQNQPANYGNLICFGIGEPLEVGNWDFVNIPMVNWPVSNLINCPTCELWINPKIWNTTPATWTGTYGDNRTWITD
jgi:hypothetical protein